MDDHCGSVTAVVSLPQDSVMVLLSKPLPMAQDADLDSTDHDAVPSVAQKASRVAVVAFEPGRGSAFEPACPSGFARMAG